jgi:hypothetical protein
MEASPCSNVPTSNGKHPQMSVGCYISKGLTNSILMPVILELMFNKQMLDVQDTFDHVVSVQGAGQ